MKSNSLFHLVNNVSFFFHSVSLRFSENQPKKCFSFFLVQVLRLRVSESIPQNISTGKLNLVLIVIVLLAIFVVAIAVVFGMSFFGATKVIRTKASLSHYLNVCFSEIFCNDTFIWISVERNQNNVCFNSFFFCWFSNHILML